MTRRLYDLLTDSAAQGLKLQAKDGSFPKGTNGPWLDNDTYVRTTAHWAILQYKVYEITQEKRFKVSAVKALDYLLKDICRPYGYTFYCREGDKKDKCNGLIGQAWALESLLTIGNKIGDPKYTECARTVIDCCQYDHKKHLWKMTEIDGSIVGYRQALNQHIWFSTMVLIAGIYLNNQEFINNATDFFENVLIHIEFIEDGLINHINRNYKNNLLSNAKKVASVFSLKATNIKKRSIGYLSFILYGFSILYSYTNNHSFWKKEQIKNMIRSSFFFIHNKRPYFCGDDGSNYLWGYNPVGIEMAYTIQTFNEYIKLNANEDDIKYWLGLQINHYYNFKNHTLSENTIDANLLSARLYEATYLKNYMMDDIPFGGLN